MACALARELKLVEVVFSLLFVPRVEKYEIASRGLGVSARFYSAIQRCAVPGTFLLLRTGSSR